MASRLERLMSRRLAIRVIAALIVVLLGSVVLQQHFTFSRQEEIHRATTMDFMNNRLAALASDIQASSLSGRSATNALLSYFAAYSSVSAADARLYQAKLEEYLIARPNARFVRYVPEDGGGPALAAGDERGVPTAGEEGSPFTELVEASSTLRSGEMLLSGLTDLASPEGEESVMLYGISPVRHGQKTFGYLEFGYSMTPLLNDVKHARREGEWLFLLDNYGRYLTGPDGDVPLEASFFDDYPPAVTDAVYGPNPSGDFVQGGKVFMYRHIMVPGIRYGLGERQYWVLVNVSDEGQLFSDSANTRREYVLTLVTLMLLVLTCAALVWVLQRQHNQPHAASR
jgi:hypothetical protein